MQPFRTSLLLAAAVSALAAGCEDAARKPLQANVAALHPAAPLEQQSPRPTQTAVAIAPLPLWSRGAERPPSLLPALADDKSQLIARVQAKFASGEQNFKAGHLDAARRDFDAAVDLMLTSGYDLEKDPQLRELFRRVVDS